MQVVQRVIEKWRKSGTNLRPVASAHDLLRLEGLLGAPLPDDVREYFASADGMVDGNVGDHMVSWWSIDRIFREMEDMARSRYRIDPRDVPIADVLINSWFIFLRRRSPDSIGVFVEAANLELPSLTDFFVRYEADPASLAL